MSCGSVFHILNPLMPVPPMTARDEPWPFLLLWRHRLWPKLASSILNFCRRERSFQWCPDQSDRLNGALDMHKNAQKVEWKTQSKVSCHYTWLLHAKNCLSQWRFLRSFFNRKKPSRRSITTAKKKRKGEKGKAQKIPKIEKPKNVGHFLLQKLSKFWFLCMPKSQWTKTWCWWQERQAVVLQIHFQPD